MRLKVCDILLEMVSLEEFFKAYVCTTAVCQLKFTFFGEEEEEREVS